MAASTSTSTASISCHDVFISHRGPDVKKGFASHLYRRLRSYGLRVFLDQPELQRGDYFIHQIDDAIRSASVHVAIFSSGYADSKWCLDELVQMLDSKAPIIPVFYGVKPTELRRTLGKEKSYTETYKKRSYAEALEELEKKTDYDPITDKEKLRYDSSTIENWRNALSRVADISGFELEACNGDEGELVDKIVEWVLKKVKKPALDAAKYPTGLDDKVKDFENSVLFQQQARGKPRIFGIVGLGGVGKTTLVKELFNMKNSNHHKSCFLSDVRDNAGKGYLNSLQRILLKSLTGWDNPVNSVDEGIGMLRMRLSSTNALVIIDDVDHVDQVYVLLPHPTVLHPDSLILITSRNKDVLISSGVEESSIYNLTGLTTKHSLELFCLHSFNQSYPPREFESLVNKFLEACGGLPLSLKVIGALLFGKYDKSDWKDLLDKLQQVLPSETQEKLQISYQSLNMEEQQMFLDTACFFIGQKRDTAIRTWDGSGWQGLLGFQTLEKRCLLEVDIENNIDMHEHLRDFGKAVADASLPRRLLHSTAIKDMLEQLSIEQVTNVPNEQVTAVRGIRVVLGEDNDEVDPSGGIDTRTLELVDALDGIDMRTLALLDTENVILERILRKPMHVPSLIWLRWNNCPNLSLPSWIPMQSLRVLQVSGRVLKTLWEDESQVPLQLRELEINAPLSNIPKSIGRLEHLERIVIARFLSGHVHLTKLPEEFCYLRSLRALVLTECSKMKSLPDSFRDLWDLQHIDLSFCCNLERLPDSIRYLWNLRHINLSYCHDLERLPDYIGRLRGLQHIDLRGCHNLESLPDSFGELRDLRHINLSGCHDLQRLPDSFVNLRYLQHIDLQGCHNLQWLPDGFGDLMNLEDVNLSNCHDLERLPDSFSNLRNLQYIDLSGCHNLERLPNYFRNFNKLKYLDVEGCSNLIIETIEITDNLPEAHQRQLEQLYLSDA